MYHIISLVPFYKNCTGELSPWYFVLLNKWTNTHKFFNPSWETSLTYNSKKHTLCLTSYWIKPNNSLSNFFYKKWKMPWIFSFYKKEILKDNKWLEKNYRDIPDTFKTNFYVYVKNKKIPIKVNVTAQKIFYGIRCIPRPFKKWFTKHVEVIKICLEGPEVLYLSYPFKKDLPTSWLNFEYYELSKYLKSLYKG